MWNGEKEFIKKNGETGAQKKGREGSGPSGRKSRHQDRNTQLCIKKEEGNCVLGGEKGEFLMGKEDRRREETENLKNKRFQQEKREKGLSS